MKKKTGVFFTADTHFGHPNIIKYCKRQFLCERDEEALVKAHGDWSQIRVSEESVAAMDDCLIDKINSVVGKNDVLYHLGDFVFGRHDNYREKCRFYRQRIKCENIHLIWGNHDRDEISDLFSSCWDSVVVKTKLGHERIKILLRHYYLPNWDHADWHLYGHSHGKAEKLLDEENPRRQSFDIGVDNTYKLIGEYYRPLEISEIQAILARKKKGLIK